MTRAGHYIVVTHSERPAPGERTETPNWGQTAKWEKVEQVEFVSRLKKRHIDVSAIVIDYPARTFIKNRMPHLDVDTVINHVAEKYPQQFWQFTKLIANS